MPNKKKILQYEEENMIAALTAVRNGLAVATAARQYAVPRTTLWCKVHGKYPVERKMGPSSFFTQVEESTIVNWIKLMARKKFPITKNNLILCARRLAIELKKNNNDGRVKLGKKWFAGFMKRHPDISQRVSQNLTKSRRDVTEGQIRNWFSEVQEYLTLNSLYDVLNDPTRVFNADESAFFLNPKGLKVLAPRGDKSIYQTANNDEKECLTVLVNCNAAGVLAPPLVIFRYTRIPAVLAESVPKEWGIGRSESGWMTAEGFYEYITNVFHPWLVTTNITLPIILFVDGHSSHMSIHLSTFCSQKGIILIALFPNATHLLQPLDVAVFKTLKACWKEKVYTWKLENKITEMKRHHFAPILNEVLEERVTPEILANGFRKCGLLPWNADAVAFEKTNISENARPTATQNFVSNKDALQTLEQFIGKEKLDKFTQCTGIWEGDIRDTSLFEYWKTISYKSVVSNSLERINSSVNVSLHKEHAKETPTENNINIANERETQNIVLTPMKESTLTSSVDSPLHEFENRTILAHSTPLQTEKRTALQPENLSEKSPVMLVPTPFKKALFWPEEKEHKGLKRKKQKVPTVITSQIWQEFNTRKKQEKEKNEKEKQERKLKREMAKKNKEKAAENKKRCLKDSESDSEEIPDEVSFMESDDSPWNEQEEVGCEDIISINNKNQLSQGSFVLVAFMGGKRLTQKFIYVCIVQDITSSELSVMALKNIDTAKKTFIANENDVSYVKLDQVIGLLNTPKIISQGERVRYVFEKPVEDINEK